MLNLEGYLSAEEYKSVMAYTAMRLSNPHEFQTPEALALYEQQLLPEEEIRALCEKHYGKEFENTVISYVPQNIVDYFRGTGYVPLNFRPMQKVVQVAKLPELQPFEVRIDGYEIIVSDVPIYTYMQLYQKYYGTHPQLQIIPPKQLFDTIAAEAIKLGAADITITNEDKCTKVYYNVRKRRVDSHYVFDYTFINEVIKILTAKSQMMPGTRMPKDVDYSLNADYRCRCLINYKFGGYTVTIRMLPNAAFDTPLESLSLTTDVYTSMRKYILDARKGLRLIVGETMSGKNTTAQSLLREIAQSNRYKIVSIGMPVEQRLPGVEQISADTPEEYEADVRSLVRMNPDFVYLEEIRDAIAPTVLQMVNTGKCVLSTLHANSVADTISRLVDITGQSQDRVIQTLHSVYYQELVRDDEKDIIYPRSRYVVFTDEFKYQLYGKSLGEVIKLIEDRELGDTWVTSQDRHL